MDQAVVAPLVDILLRFKEAIVAIKELIVMFSPSFSFLGLLGASDVGVRITPQLP